MPFFERDGVKIQYQDSGDGWPLLAIAPGGMRSSIAAWEGRPWTPERGAQDGYRVIAMDQRNAGESTAPVREGDGWERYTEDQLALLDHLGVERFSVVGMCIGGAYIMGLIRAAPERIAAAVMLQPIGLEQNRHVFYELFDGWADELRPGHPEASASDWAAFREAMYGGEFLFNGTRDEVKSCTTPLLVLMGDDVYHPSAISREVADLAPNAQLIEEWKEGEARERALAAVNQFLRSHAS